MAGIRGLSCLAVAALFAASSAAAEPSAADRESSRALYGDGMRAIDARDFVAAEKACRGAYSLVKAPTSAVCFARALQGLGRLVEARDIFLEAVRFPIAPNEPPVFGEAREQARAESDKLASRIPTIVVVASGPTETARLALTIDGATIGADSARLPRKVDPGLHVVVVSAPGFRQSRVEVTVAEAEVKRVAIGMKRDDASATTIAPAPTPETPSPDRSLAYVAFGIGGAGLLIGVATGLVAGAKHGALAGECDANNVCAPSAQSDLDAFHTMRTVSTIGYVIGAVAVVAGGVLWLTAPTGRASATSARVFVAPTSAGVAGTF